jgi:hypothetical protein
VLCCRGGGIDSQDLQLSDFVKVRNSGRKVRTMCVLSDILSRGGNPLVGKVRQALGTGEVGSRLSTNDRRSSMCYHVLTDIGVFLFGSVDTKHMCIHCHALYST